jgi:L-fucose mutarotase/ribose pyranase (RbsD/FucU family)
MHYNHQNHTLNIQTTIEEINTYASPYKSQFIHIFHDFAYFSQSRHIFSILSTQHIRFSTKHIITKAILLSMLSYNIKHVHKIKKKETSQTASFLCFRP